MKPTDASREFLQRQIVTAARYGHSIDLEVINDYDVAPSDPWHIKHYGVCSCGWRSKAKRRKSGAFYNAIGHCGEVIGGLDAEERDEGSRVSSSAVSEAGGTNTAASDRRLETGLPNNISPGSHSRV